MNKEQLFKIKSQTLDILVPKIAECLKLGLANENVCEIELPLGKFYIYPEATIIHHKQVSNWTGHTMNYSTVIEDVSNKVFDLFHHDDMRIDFVEKLYSKLESYQTHQKKIERFFNKINDISITLHRDVILEKWQKNQ